MFTSGDGVSSRPQNSGQLQEAPESRPISGFSDEIDNTIRGIGSIDRGEILGRADAEIAVPMAERELREIFITPLSSGYYVKIGCQTVAVESNETLIAALTNYLNNPTEFEKKWYSNNKRNKLENIL